MQELLQWEQRACLRLNRSPSAPNSMEMYTSMDIATSLPPTNLRGPARGATYSRLVLHGVSACASACSQSLPEEDGRVKASRRLIRKGCLRLPLALVISEDRRLLNVG